MWVHFFHRHVRDTVIILEEVNLPHPRYPRCDMLFPWWALNGWYITTAHFSKGAERKQQWMVKE